MRGAGCFAFTGWLWSKAGSWLHPIPSSPIFPLSPKILRLDELSLELPKPKNHSANDAAAVQELLGGKFGKMSTLMNYTF